MDRFSPSGYAEVRKICNRENTGPILKGGSGQTHTLVGVSVAGKAGLKIPTIRRITKPTKWALVRVLTARSMS
jgi:hypothetical protein